MRARIHGDRIMIEPFVLAACAEMLWQDKPIEWRCTRLDEMGFQVGLVDHPGVPFARAEDTIALVFSIDNPRQRLNLDLYHAQIGEGNLIALCRKALPWIGEIQVADVPGRHEPGTGEVNYAGVARGLNEMGYRGPVAMETWPSGDSDAALEAFRAAFTI
jgi:hydroxypyruvate isomerase